MRHIGGGLYGALVKLVADLVEQEGQDDGGREMEDQVEQVDEDGVADHPPEIIAVEEVDKVAKSDPGTRHDAHERTVVLEGDDGTVDRAVMEDRVIGQDRQ